MIMIRVWNDLRCFCVWHSTNSVQTCPVGFFLSVLILQISELYSRDVQLGWGECWLKRVNCNIFFLFQNHSVICTWAAYISHSWSFKPSTVGRFLLFRFFMTIKTETVTTYYCCCSTIIACGIQNKSYRCVKNNFKKCGFTLSLLCLLNKVWTNGIWFFILFIYFSLHT